MIAVYFEGDDPLEPVVCSLWEFAKANDELSWLDLMELDGHGEMNFGGGAAVASRVIEVP